MLWQHIMPVVRGCSSLYRKALPWGSIIRCHNTDYVHVNGHDRTITVILAKHYIKLPDDESLVIRNMLEQF